MFVGSWAYATISGFLLLQFIIAFTFNSFPVLNILVCRCSIKCHAQHRGWSLHLVTCIIYFSDLNLWLDVSKRLLVVFDCRLFVALCLFVGDMRDWCRNDRRRLAICRILWFLGLWVVANGIFFMSILFCLSSGCVGFSF